MNYKETLNLPRTKFKMRAGLPVKEPLRIKEWDAGALYHRIMERNADKPRFILHDGPPYANGHIHSGTVLNKILKDFIVKHRNMTGSFCEYIPGWDCHGLPVENNVEREEGRSKDEFSIEEFRTKCEAYARRFVGIQREEFKRLGVLGLWEEPYLTVDKSYEATIAREFGKVVESGALYKRKRPVYWCAHHVTALADAEVEYEDLTSPSIWVKFEMGDEVRAKIPGLAADTKAYVVIWTTTPWTLPANLAITLHPKLEYSAVESGGEVYLVATDLVRRFTTDCSLAPPRELAIVKGAELEGLNCRHPFVDRDSLIIMGDFVSIETGTGCVHTAPGHGADDYEAGLRYGLEAYAPVDDKGKFTAEVPEYAGRFVFETDEDIVEMLGRKGALLARRDMHHSYPVCQRCKKPIVFRATSQWFVDIDKTGIRKRALEIIPEVDWIPPRGEQRILSMVETRPDWCLSRQRLWGVPIIAFYCKKCDEPLLDANIIYGVADLFEQEGAASWFARPVSKLVPAGTACQACGHDDFEKETDIVDVWFESGVSYAATIEKRYGPETVTDLYLEGSDQHRGWFQSSLLESVISRDRAPFASVLTHGFVVDGDGRKISKTLGNFVPPEEIINKYGAEIYRLWVAAENYQEDVRISDEVLKTLVDAYMKIRNTFRFLLGNLAGFDPATDMVPAEEMAPLDRYIVHRLDGVVQRLTTAYENYRFHEIFQLTTKFFAVELSAFYLDLLKDRLYVLPVFSADRRSARTALYEILSAMVRVLAPVCSFTCEEVWSHMPKGEDDPDSVFLTDFPGHLTDRYHDEELAESFARLLEIRELANKEMEQKRRDGVIGHSLDADVSIIIGDEHPAYEAVNQYGGLLREMLIVSSVRLETVPGESLTFEAGHAPGEKCGRCWNWSESVGGDSDFEDVCARCGDILRQLNVQPAAAE